VVRDGGREMYKREFWMEVDPIKSSQASVKSLFDSFKTLLVVALCERITNKTKVNQT
jgi:hypothetical protein